MEVQSGVAKVVMLTHAKDHKLGVPLLVDEGEAETNRAYSEVRPDDHSLGELTVCDVSVLVSVHEEGEEVVVVAAS
jgi:hypothetical protein